MLSKSKTLNLLYTLGDIGGIGPEIFFKFVKDLKQINEQEWYFNETIKITLADDLQALKKDTASFKIGQASAASGEHSYQTLMKAHEMCRDGLSQYLITGPVSKESLSLANHHYSGQTEVLANLNNLKSSEVEMLFIAKDLRILLATRHIALVKVPLQLKENFPNTLSNAVSILGDIFKIKSPRIGITGINPHAGENGLIGDEESTWMNTVIERFRELHPQSTLSEALPADSLLAQAARKFLKNEPPDYDLYISAYHDQCLPLIKGIAAYNAINMTCGLPYIRVSVDHGCAFDIAGKELADPSALLACTEFCINLSRIQQTA